MAKGRENPQRKRAQSMQIFNQFQLEKSLLFVALRALILQLFLSVYVGLGAVKRIKTNVRHLREENEVEKDRERQRECAGGRGKPRLGLFSMAMASEDA